MQHYYSCIYDELARNIIAAFIIECFTVKKIFLLCAVYAVVVFLLCFTFKPAYKTQCSQKNPYRCELGDTSNKVGTYNIGSGKAFYADVDMPLFGTKSGTKYLLVKATF